MTAQQYTDEELRNHVTWLIKTHGDEIETLSITETAADHGVNIVGWNSDDWDTYIDAVWKLIRAVPDLTDWAVSLAANSLKDTTELAWGHGDTWHFAVQVACREGAGGSFYDDLIDTVRDAVQARFTALHLPIQQLD